MSHIKKIILCSIMISLSFSNHLLCSSQKSVSSHGLKAVVSKNDISCWKKTKLCTKLLLVAGGLGLVCCCPIYGFNKAYEADNQRLYWYWINNLDYNFKNLEPHNCTHNYLSTCAPSLLKPLDATMIEQTHCPDYVKLDPSIQKILGSSEGCRMIVQLQQHQEELVSHVHEYVHKRENLFHKYNGYYYNLEPKFNSASAHDTIRQRKKSNDDEIKQAQKMCGCTETKKTK